MREIKFRAYIKRDYNKELVGKILEVSSLHLKKNKVIIGYSISKSNYGNKSFNYKDIELMQYTGLKDKNGKEIYEGDIVSFNLKSDNEGQPNIIGYIEYQTTFSGYKIMSFKGSFALDYNIKDIEVIGNIYEKSELLKGE